MKSTSLSLRQFYTEIKILNLRVWSIKLFEQPFILNVSSAVFLLFSYNASIAWIQTLEPDILVDCSTNSSTKGLFQVISYTLKEL